MLDLDQPRVDVVQLTQVASPVPTSTGRIGAAIDAIRAQYGKPPLRLDKPDGAEPDADDDPPDRPH